MGRGIQPYAIPLSHAHNRSTLIHSNYMFNNFQLNHHKQTDGQTDCRKYAATNDEGYQTNDLQMCMGSIAGGQGQSYGWMWVVTRLGRAVIFMRAFTRTLVHAFARLLVCCIYICTLARMCICMLAGMCICTLADFCICRLAY